MLWYCLTCTAAYAPGAPRCPQCGSTEHTDVPPDQRPAAELTPSVGEPPAEAEPASKRARK